MKPSSPNTPGRPLLLALVLTAVGVAVAYALLGRPPLLGAEDAAIGFRYARNLAQGYGIVFNPGGERVEGFTSLLWLFVSAIVFLLVGEAALEPALQALSLVATGVAPAVILWILSDALLSAERSRRTYEGTVQERESARRFRRLGPPGLWMAVLWLAAQPGFYFWAGLSLMEVALWSMGLAVYLMLLHRRLEGTQVPRGALVAVVVALTLTRPESMLLLPATAAGACIVHGLGREVRRVAAQVLGATAVAVAALTGFRIAYFGHPLPNTYYAKVSPDVAFRVRSGLGYVGDYLGAHPTGWVGVAAVGAFLIVAARAAVRGRARGPLGDPAIRLATMAAVLVAAGIAAVVWEGGDHYRGHRFLQPYLPLVAIPLGVGFGEGVRRLAARSAGASRMAWVAVLALFAAPIPAEWTTFRDHGLRRQATDIGLEGRFVATTLNEAFAGETAPELGLWMVGGAGYVYDGAVKDLLGLNWIAMGMSPGDRKGPRDHAAFDADVFWSAPPELMLPEPVPVLAGYGLRCVGVVMGGVMNGVLTTPRMRERFVPVRIQRGDGVPIIAYGRRDWMARAPSAVEPLDWSYCDGIPAGR